MQLGFHVGPKQLDLGLFKNCCLFMRYVLLAGLSYLASVGEVAAIWVESCGPWEKHWGGEVEGGGSGEVGRVS